MFKISATMFVLGVAGIVAGFVLGLDPVRIQAADRLMTMGIGLMIIFPRN